LGRGGSRKVEIYNNKLVANTGNFSAIVFQENGAGVIYNNTMTGWIVGTAQLQVYRTSGKFLCDGGSNAGSHCDQDADCPNSTCGRSTFNYTGHEYGNCWGSGNNCGWSGTENCWNGSLPHGSYDGNLESTGWPCLDQIGRASGVALGTAQGTLPMYLWNNGTQDKCYKPSDTGAACDGQAGAFPAQSTNEQWPGPGGANDISLYLRGYDAKNGVDTTHSGSSPAGDRDYCVAQNISYTIDSLGRDSMPGAVWPDSSGTKCGNHTFAYTPYTYPHPLQGSAPSSSNTTLSTGAAPKLSSGAGVKLQ
jgi:hypothetical protein